MNLFLFTYEVTTGCILPIGHSVLLPNEFKPFYLKNLKLFLIRVKNYLSLQFCGKKVMDFALF